MSGFKAEQGIGVGQRIQEVEQALSSSTLLIDQSHWGVIRVEGKDRLRFLHSQGTNAFEGVPAGKLGAIVANTSVFRFIEDELVLPQFEVFQFTDSSLNA